MVGDTSIIQGITTRRTNTIALVLLLICCVLVVQLVVDSNNHNDKNNTYYFRNTNDTKSYRNHHQKHREHDRRYKTSMNASVSNKSITSDTVKRERSTSDNTAPLSLSWTVLVEYSKILRRYNRQKRNRRRQVVTAPDNGDYYNAQIQPRIIGGSKAQLGEYPYYAYPSGNMLCGATLIWQDILLTAAHCADAFKDGVIIGGITIDGATSSDPWIPVSVLYQHPDFTEGPEYNDIMIVKLDRPSIAQIVELNFDPDTSHYDEWPATIIGFGNTAENGHTSADLLKASIDIIPYEECLQYFGPNLQEDTVICAGTDDGKYDACQGDSGGPLFDFSMKQIGIVSFGNGCGRPGSPAVYTKISAFQEWITSTTCLLSSNPPTYCNNNVSGDGSANSSTDTITSTELINAGAIVDSALNKPFDPPTNSNLHQNQPEIENILDLLNSSTNVDTKTSTVVSEVPPPLTSVATSAPIETPTSAPVSVESTSLHTKAPSTSLPAGASTVTGMLPKPPPPITILTDTPSIEMMEPAHSGMKAISDLEQAAEETHHIIYTSSSTSNIQEPLLIGFSEAQAVAPFDTAVGHDEVPASVTEKYIMEELANGKASATKKGKDRPSKKGKDSSRYYDPSYGELEEEMAGESLEAMGESYYDYAVMGAGDDIRTASYDKKGKEKGKGKSSKKGDEYDGFAMDPESYKTKDYGRKGITTRIADKSTTNKAKGFVLKDSAFQLLPEKGMEDDPSSSSIHRSKGKSKKYM